MARLLFCYNKSHFYVVLAAKQAPQVITLIQPIAAPAAAPAPIVKLVQVGGSSSGASAGAGAGELTKRIY